MRFRSTIILLCLLLLANNSVFSMGESPSSQQQSIGVSEPASVATATEQNKTHTVYITKTGKKYHRANCRYLKYSSIPIGLDNAVELGYMPCSVCDPPLVGEPLGYKQNVRPPTEKEDIVYITKTGSKYHRLGCRYLRRSSIPISLKKAEEYGYSPCSVC